MLLLAAFVFRLPWLVPVVGLFLTVVVVAGTRADPFHVLFARTLAPRLGPPETTVPSDTVRAQNTLVAGLTGVATLSFLLGIGFIGWLLVVAAAFVAALAAATSLHLGDQVRRLLSR